MYRYVTPRAGAALTTRAFFFVSSTAGAEVSGAISMPEQRCDIVLRKNTFCR